MSENENNDFYKITAMSAAFRKWDAGRPVTQSQEETAKVWELRFLCAIAQQLTMVAAHLGKIVGKAEHGSH